MKNALFILSLFILAPFIHAEDNSVKQWRNAKKLQLLEQKKADVQKQLDMHPHQMITKEVGSEIKHAINGEILLNTLNWLLNEIEKIKNEIENTKKD